MTPATITISDKRRLQAELKTVRGKLDRAADRAQEAKGFAHDVGARLDATRGTSKHH